MIALTGSISSASASDHVLDGRFDEWTFAPVAPDDGKGLIREVRIAAGRLGRLTLWGADMWIKDQYVDIFCRWVYLPLYAILAAISLNEST